MATPYRSAGVRVEGPRPLEPEDEMRLLLEAPDWPRGARKVVPFGLALLAVALVAINLRSLKDTLFASVYGVPILVSPLVGLLVAQLKHRRRVKKLRAAGYDVDSAVAPHLRVANDPRVRIGAESVDESIDDNRALEHVRDAEMTASSKAAGSR